MSHKRTFGVPMGLGLLLAVLQVGLMTRATESRRTLREGAMLEHMQKQAAAGEWDVMSEDAFGVDADTGERLSGLRAQQYFVLHGFPVLIAFSAGLLVGSRFLLVGVLACWPEVVTYPFSAAHLAFIGSASIPSILFAGVIAAAIHGSCGGLLAGGARFIRKRINSSRTTRQMEDIVAYPRQILICDVREKDDEESHNSAGGHDSRRVCNTSTCSTHCR